MTYLTIGQVGDRARRQGMVFSRPPEVYPAFKLRYREEGRTDADGRTVFVFDRLEDVVHWLDVQSKGVNLVPTLQRRTLFDNAGACRDLETRDKRSASDY